MSSDETVSDMELSTFGAGDSSEVSSPEETVESPPVSFLVFSISGYRITHGQGVPMEFLDNQVLFGIPTSHPLLGGLINRRGSLVPVFDIRKLMNTEPRKTSGEKVLVLGRGDDAVGIILDDTPHRVTLSDDAKTEAPAEMSELFGRYLSDCFRDQNGYVLNIDLDNFLFDLAHGVD